MRPLSVTAMVSALVLVSGSVALADHAWGNYHWERSSNPLVLDLGSNLSTDYTGPPGPDYFDIAVDDWDEDDTSSVLRLNTVHGGNLKGCGAVDGRVEVCNDSYGFRRGGWLGVATIWADGDHITKATVQLNDTFLLGSGTYNTPEWRQMVMCQEIGHVFGLDHQDENFYNANLGTCMDYTDDPASNQHPDSHDIGMLSTIYDPDPKYGGHVDALAGGGDGGGDGGGGCPPRNPNCGQGALKAPPFSQASRANGSVYVDQMRNGLTRIKHVFWVPRR